MPSASQVLRIYETGPTTVVGFARDGHLDDLELFECNQGLTSLVEQNNCKILVFDLRGITFVPSAMLGVLASLTKRGTEVRLHNASTQLREVLAVTRLDRILKVCDTPL